MEGLILYFTVARSQYGGLLIRHRRIGNPCLLPRLRRLRLDHLLHQHSRNLSCLLLLDLWSEIWSATNGAVPILLRLLRGEAEYVIKASNTTRSNPTN
jgi:hypothetical protein